MKPNGKANQGVIPMQAGFIFSVAIVLMFTGVAKVWTAFGSAKVLTIADPIVGLQFKHLMLAVGMAEIVVAMVCLFGNRQTLALGLTAWVSSSFLFYRLGLWWIGWKRPCSCLGNLTDALHISPQVADNIMKGVLAYLLIGSYGVLIWQFRRRSALGAARGGKGWRSEIGEQKVGG